MGVSKLNASMTIIIKVYVFPKGKGLSNKNQRLYNVKYKKLYG